MPSYFYDSLFLFGLLTKKRHCLSAMSSCCPFRATHKKRHCLTAMSSFGVPGRTRTVDIQNHKHFYGLFGNPFVHRGFRRLEKTRLRLFCGKNNKKNWISKHMNEKILNSSTKKHNLGHKGVSRYRLICITTP